ncbi:MAG TPA: NAD(P)-dependent alcohol dehydrogenase [Opitutaceae bacterium]|nr:NAD(P)-dependent alcohol dehydrogenase [Opitutaceae bacterium]
MNGKIRRELVKAIVYRTYGSPEVLRLEETEKPAAADGEVLIKVSAASVNPLDWHFMRGMPYLMRLGIGLHRPKAARLGVDVAGRIEAVGRNVTQFKPGDEVFGICRGAFAEYACTPESAVIQKRGNVTFEQAAAVPVAAVTALQGLRDKGRIQAGQKVLINGASGGVGTFAVQIAKALGAEVTGVCSARNMELVRSLGADRVVDYARDDFTKGGQRYHLVFDCIGNHSLLACRRVLDSKGIYIIIGAPGGRWIAPLPRVLNAMVLSRFVGQNFLMHLTRRRREDLTTVQDLIAAGKVTPVIDRRCRLSEVPEAIRYLESGHARGKIIITVDSDEPN